MTNSSPPDSAPDLDILGDQVTVHPGGYVGPLETPGHNEDRNLVEHMARFRQSPFDFLREVSLHVSGQGWRAHDDVLGQPTFYSGFSEKMKANVMQAEILDCKIRELARQRVQVEEDSGLLGSGASLVTKRHKRREEIEGDLKEVALEMTDAMICKMESKLFIRSAYYLCTQLLTRAYHQGVHVSSEEVLRLRLVAAEAAKKKRSIIFLPCHRSHVDYVSLQLICYRLGIALPTVVAGDNLNFPVVGSFLQHAGAMWIRRSFGDDALYTALVQSYVDTLLNNGYNFECFIEGGRSRTGKLLSPKFGILSFLLDSILSGRVEDAIVCPVSTQYDKVIETESYASELLGQRVKAKENIQDFLSASSVLSLRLGRVDVRFSEPWSLKDFIEAQQARMTNESALPATGPHDAYHPDNRIRILRTLGYKVLSDINAVSVVMPTALIGTILLTLRGRGVGKSELIRRVDWLSEQVRRKGGRVAHFGGAATEVVIERGLDVLGKNLVDQVDGLPETTYFAVDRFQLSFYRNMTIHLFISEALVSAAMYMKIKQGGAPANQEISFDDLYQQTQFLSSLFRGEFIYPTAGLKQNLLTTLRGLEIDGVLRLQRTTSDRIASAGLSDQERRSGRENYDFYCFLIWPFVESTWLASIFLMGLKPTAPPIDTGVSPDTGPHHEVWLDLAKTQDAAQLLGKTLYHQGDLSYFEAVNKETLKNAFQLFEEEGIILVRKGSKDKKIPAAMRLAEEWMPVRDAQTGHIRSEGKLWAFSERIALSRREGKNRRDGATVSDRVLKLADMLGRTLFQHQGAGVVVEARPDDSRKGRQKKRRQGIGEKARL